MFYSILINGTCGASCSGSPLIRLEKLDTEIITELTSGNRHIKYQCIYSVDRHIKYHSTYLCK